MKQVLCWTLLNLNFQRKMQWSSQLCGVYSLNRSHGGWNYMLAKIKIVLWFKTFSGQKISWNNNTWKHASKTFVVFGLVLWFWTKGETMPPWSSKRDFQDCSISIRELEVWNRTSGANSWHVFPWIGRLESKRNRRFLFEGTECLSEGTEFCGDLRQIVHLIMELSRCGKKNKAKCFEIFFQICGWSFRLTCFCSEVLTCTDVVVMQKPGILGGCVHRGHAEDLPRLCEKSQGSLSFCFKHATNCQVITPGWEERVLFQPEMWWHQWHGGGSGQPIFFFRWFSFMYCIW